MKYVVKEPQYAGLTLDADAMMREFNRAMGVVHEDVDQNNVSSSTVSISRIASPSSNWEIAASIAGKRGTSANTALHASYQDNGYAHSLTAPSNVGSGSTEARDTGGFWENITANTDEDPLELSLTLGSNTMGTVIATGQVTLATAVALGNERTCPVDFRMTDQGSQLDTIFTTSCEVDGGLLPVYLCVSKVFVAGEHVFRLQGKDRSNPPSAVTMMATVSLSSLYFYGFVR